MDLQSLIAKMTAIENSALTEGGVVDPVGEIRPGQITNPPARPTKKPEVKRLEKPLDGTDTELDDKEVDNKEVDEGWKEKAGAVALAGAAALGGAAPAQAGGWDDIMRPVNQVYQVQRDVNNVGRNVGLEVSKDVDRAGRDLQKIPFFGIDKFGKQMSGNYPYGAHPEPDRSPDAGQRQGQNAARNADLQGSAAAAGYGVNNNNRAYKPYRINNFESKNMSKEEKCTECNMLESKCKCPDELSEMLKLAGRLHPYIIGEAKKKKPDADKDGIPDYAKDGKGKMEEGLGVAEEIIGQPDFDHTGNAGRGSYGAAENTATTKHQLGSHVYEATTEQDGDGDFSYFIYENGKEIFSSIQPSNRNQLGHRISSALLDEHKKATAHLFDSDEDDDYDAKQGMAEGKKVEEDDVEEGNAFSKAVRDAKKDGIQHGEKINVGGKKYPVKETTSADLMRRWTGIFETKEKVKEGMGDDNLRARFDTYVYDGMTPQQAAENLSKGFLARGFDDMTPEYILRVCAGSTAVTPKQKTATTLNKAKSMLGSMYETEQGKETVDEGWDDMMAANKKQADDEKKSKGTGKFDKKTTTTGTEYTRKASTFDNGTEDPRRPAKTMQSKKDKKPMGESMEDCMTDDSGADDNFSINSSMDSSGHKSVSISASGSKADELTQILKNAGLGIMGSEDHAEPDADDMGGPSDHDVDNMGGGDVEVVSIPLAHHDGYQAPEPEVEVDEAAKWRAPEHKGKLYTQEPPDYNDSREYDNAIYDPKPDNYPGRKKLPAGGEYDRTDPLEKGYRRSADNSINTAGKRKGLPSRDQISSLKNSIRDAHGTHAQPNLPEAAGSIDFDKVLDAIAALYGDDMWENDAMQDLANDLAQAGPTDPELDFIIAKGRLPKRLANTQFSAGDNVQFGEEYSNEPRTQVQPVSTQMRQGNDLNREKQQHKHSYRQGDNPMAMEDRQAAAKLEKELMEELSSLKVVSKKYAGKKLG